MGRLGVRVAPALAKSQRPRAVPSLRVDALLLLVPLLELLRVGFRTPLLVRWRCLLDGRLLLGLSCSRVLIGLRPGLRSLFLRLRVRLLRQLLSLCDLLVLFAHSVVLVRQRGHFGQGRLVLSAACELIFSENETHDIVTYDTAQKEPCNK